MKISIEIDCTPAEARSFFGLPDVEAFQKEAMAEMQKRMAEHMQAMNPEDIMKAWMPSGLQAMERMQEAFMAQFGGGGQAPGRGGKG